MPRRILEALLGVCTEGLRRPVPFFENASYAYAKQQQKIEGGTGEKAPLACAREAFEQQMYERGRWRLIGDRAERLRGAVRARSRPVRRGPGRVRRAHLRALAADPRRRGDPPAMTRTREGGVGREIAFLDLVHTPITGGTTLIEASAGTGKTYCLTGLVLRLLLEEHVSGWPTSWS
jgi:hypothetical protein